MNANTRMLLNYGGKKVTFNNLPTEHRKAIIWYMAVDGTAWKILDDLGKNINDGPESNELTPANKAITESVLMAYTKKYGTKTFLYGNLPTSLLKKKTYCSLEENGGWKSFEEAHRWYVKNNTVSNHRKNNRWPCILADYTADTEVFQDGWHRFHCYVRQGARKIPVLAFS